MSDTEPYDMDDLERRLGALARSITDSDRQLLSPPPDLLTAITTELAGHEVSDPAPRVAVRPATPAGEPVGDRNVSAPTSALGSGPDQATRAPSTVTDLAAERKRRRGLTLWGGLSAAAALAVMAVSALYLTGLTDDDPGAGTSLASATIANDGLPVAFDHSANANLVDDGGDLRLHVAFEGDDGALPPDVDGFYEVWLIDENVDGMISLGVLTADGQLDVPDTIEPAAFPVVDISVEPLDGDPTHSGQSVLRGVLSF